MNDRVSINLARAGDFELIEISTPGDNLASVAIVASSWGNAVVELEWSAQAYDPAQELEQEWLGFSPPVMFGANVFQRRSVDIAGSRALRLKVVSAAGGADSSADVQAFTYQNRRL